MKNTVKSAQSAQGTSPHSVQSRPAPQEGCSRTFAQAGKDRLSYPLESGAYKLREARWDLEQPLKTVEAIEQIVVTKCRPHPDELLGCCVARERNSWLKSVPNTIAHILGYYIVPAVGALAGDGVSRERVSYILEHVHAESERLVAACDEVANLIKASHDDRDFAMRRGGSLTKTLLLQAIALVDGALTQAQLRR